MKKNKNQQKLKANDSPIEVYNQIIAELKRTQDNSIDKLEETLFRIKIKNSKVSLNSVDNKEFLLHSIETDKTTIDFFVEIFSKEKINHKKIIIVKDNINTFLNARIKYLIFNVSSPIPGPIKIINNILILPGKIPECLFHETRIINIYKKVRRLYPCKKK